MSPASSRKSWLARAYLEQLQATSAVVGKAARNELDQILGVLIHSLWPIIAVLAVVALLGIVVLFQHASSGQSGSLVADIATPLLGLAGAVGLFTSRRQIQASTGGSSQPAANDVPGATGAPAAAVASDAGLAGGLANRTVALAERVGAIAGQAGSGVLADFNRGFDQAQADLKRLGYSVGLSYPLVEFFVLDSSWGNIRADVNFMNEVIWNDTDRRDEIVSVVSAAFGSLGVFAMAATQAQNPPASS
jgi:nitrate reductase NapE component